MCKSRSHSWFTAINVTFFKLKTNAVIRISVEQKKSDVERLHYLYTLTKCTIYKNKTFLNENIKEYKEHSE